MVKFFGKTITTSDESRVEKYILNTSTSTTISPADPNRIFFYVIVVGTNAEAHIKLQAASIDNDQKGILISTKPDKDSFWKMNEEFMYVGEISAIAVAGTPSIFVVEY